MISNEELSTKQHLNIICFPTHERENLNKEITSWRTYNAHCNFLIMFLSKKRNRLM